MLDSFLSETIMLKAREYPYARHTDTFINPDKKTEVQASLFNQEQLIRVRKACTYVC
jgi:hypothetical protein